MKRNRACTGQSSWLQGMQRGAALPVAVLLLTGAAGALAEDDNDFVSALTGGDVGVSVRARYEFVDQGGFPDNANAVTARLRFNYATLNWRGFSAFGEYDYVFGIIDDYNAGGGTTPDKTQYPTVADPKGPDMNQLYLDYSINDEWKLRGGRQRIILDNQRFVGGVGWRQNEQTFDALTFKTSALKNTELFYSYVGYVRRIFGNTVPAGKNNVDAQLLHGDVSLGESWAVKPYFYYIDNQDVPSFSTSTLGVRLTGDVGVGDGNIAVQAEFAAQTDAANNPASYDAQYYHVGAMWGMDNLSLGIDFESLGTDAANMQSFRTPLATLHAFQGWADMFLNTPGAGIEDFYITAKYKIDKWTLTGVYHDFKAETGGGSFGDEIDLAAGAKFWGHYGLLFTAAFYDGGGSVYPDTTKFWITFTADY